MADSDTLGDTLGAWKFSVWEEVIVAVYYTT